jgi:hypothetical protein
MASGQARRIATIFSSVRIANANPAGTFLQVSGPEILPFADVKTSHPLDRKKIYIGCVQFSTSLPFEKDFWLESRETDSFKKLQVFRYSDVGSK